MAPIAPAVVKTAPAKINLALAVGGVNAAGYHELATIYCALDLADTVTVRSSPPGSGVTCTTTGQYAHLVPTAGANLAVKAAIRLAEAYGVSGDATIEIEKRIPVAGGLAGGSTDAAATLKALAELWQLPIEPLDDLAAELGSDVPFCLYGGLATGAGHGEIVTPLPAPMHAYDWVISAQAKGLSTPTVFAELDRLRAAGLVADRATFDQPKLLARQLAELDPALTAYDPVALADAIADANDMQPATLLLRPELRELMMRAEQLGALTTIVSGSGPTCLSLCADADQAEYIAAALLAAGLCETSFATRSCGGSA